MARKSKQNAESRRLADDTKRKANWKRWGPYLSERQWGTVREDYSADGDCWNYLPHDHARSRAYRWGEDGLFGWTDRECRLCFCLGLWNGQDPILKERLFGLTGPEGNHGEDVKECYYYLDATPTYSYAKALYKYPQREFPYAQLVEEGGPSRGKIGELELADLGVFDDDRYFDVFTEYAKDGPDDTLIRITVHNRGPEAATLHVIPQVWFRNTWSWGRTSEGFWPKGSMKPAGDNAVVCDHPSLGFFQFAYSDSQKQKPALMFTDNETNALRLWKTENASRFVKDAFHEAVIHKNAHVLNPDHTGTKVGLHYELHLPAGSEAMIKLRLVHEEGADTRLLGKSFDNTFAQRLAEADEYYQEIIPSRMTGESRSVARQAYAGLLWTKQFYHYVVRDWLEGDPSMPPPPPEREEGRNAEWLHLFNRDLISMPDKWEYPWYAAWDLAFHMLPFAEIDSHFSKEQLLLFLREWYMHPNGQIPAYEFNFGDVNPPVHAWACWRVYKLTGPRGERDVQFLARTFQKLMLNFTWWVNRKDPRGKNLFSGGFLGLDNIGVFDRSKPLPTGGHLEQADGTAWMAFFCNTMLSMALELAHHDPAYEDIASKFFEHFVHIADAMNELGGSGLWDDDDGFYYDKLMHGSTHTPMKVRSMVGLIPLLAAENLEYVRIRNLHGFRKRMRWFMENREDLARHISYLETDTPSMHPHYLLAIPSRERLLSVLKYMLDENEFLSPYGIRSLSKYHEEHPFVFNTNGDEYRVKYTPAESTSDLFGGNSNWRGPIWFPLNYLIIEALEKYHHFYGEEFKVECPTGSGKMMTLKQVATEIARRLSKLFLPDNSGARPCHGTDRRYADDPHWKNLVLFYEFFHGDNGRGAGASHQTGWTALVIRCLEKMGR